MKLLKIAFLLLLPLAGKAQTSTAVNKAKLDSLMTVLEQKDKLMGAVSIYQDGKLVYDRAIGYASIKGDQKTKATTETKYRVGSISKVFTSVLILQLVEQKKLTLETPLATFFPEFKNASSITIQHLLQHRSGLKNYTAQPGFAQYMVQPKTEAEQLKNMAALEPTFTPGEKYEYSNTNFVLLGYIVEKLNKQPYAEVLKKNIVDKLGLKNTFYGGKINSAQNEASSFAFMNNQWQEMPETDMSVPHGAGAIVSTTKDLALFMQGLMQNKLLSKASMAKMKTMKNSYGLGLKAIPFQNLDGYGHGGNIDGFSSMVTYFPEKDLTMATSFNGIGTNPMDVQIGILSIATKRPYKIPTFEAPKNLTLDLANYEGTYSSEKFPLKITMRKDGDKLMTQATGQSAFELEPRSETQFVFDAAGIQIEFSKGAGAGTYNQFILKQGNGTYTFTRE